MTEPESAISWAQDGLQSPDQACSDCPSLSSSVSICSSSTLAPTPPPPECPSPFVTTNGTSPLSLSRSPSSSSTLSKNKRRGYVRPQGVSFAPSAGARDSVLSLGSISHLQHYFARTGLLDGKGAQLAAENHGKITAVAPIDEESDMLAPTVSTYSQRLPVVTPPPCLQTLRGDLSRAVQNARIALHEILKEMDRGDLWPQIQGVRVLDVITMAIKMAKTYYTSHENAQRLYSIQSERSMRERLLAVMDTLKRMASRDFAGGLRADEDHMLTEWLDGIDSVIERECELEEQDRAERNGWCWLRDELWQDREREREQEFLRFLCPTRDSFRDQTGILLVELHNTCVQRSRRPFGQITFYHTDTAKPYRCAENLRYWIKAAELRWEVKLEISVSGVVSSQAEALTAFDAAILRWSRAMREGLTKDLDLHRT